MDKTVVFGLFFLLPLFSKGQYSVNDKASHRLTVSKIEKSYLNYMKDESAFFNGVVYTGYGHLYSDGSPYFNNAKNTNGKVIFDGLLYDDKFLMFDVFQQKLIGKTVSANELFELSASSISEFNIGEVHFVKLDTVAHWNMLPGFYEMLYVGSKIKVLCRPQKELSEDMIGMSVKKSLVDNNKYYVHYNGNYYVITNLKSLYKVFPANRYELKKIARDRKLNFKADPRAALIETVKYVDDSSISQL